MSEEVLYSHDPNLGDTEYLSVAQYADIVGRNRGQEEALPGSSCADYFLEIAELAISAPESMTVQSIYQEALIRMHKEYEQAGLSIPEDMVTHLQERIKVIAEKSEAFRPLVDEYTREFINYLHDCIDLGGLPLSRDQIKSRLDQLKILFTDKQGIEGLLGAFNLTNLSLTLSINCIEEGISNGELRRTVFHELWHAISGRRIKRVNNDSIESGVSYFGFSHSKDVIDSDGKLVKLGASDDEGLIELLAIVSAKGYLINFFAEGTEARKQWDELALLIENEKECSYRERVKLVYELYKDCSAKVVFRALLKSDFDTAEPDKLVGTHAQRDLWREQKALGGRRRLSEIKTAHRTLYGFNSTFFNYSNSPMEAIAVASEERLIQIGRLVGITKAKIESLRLEDERRARSSPSDVA